MLKPETNAPNLDYDDFQELEGSIVHMEGLIVALLVLLETKHTPSPMSNAMIVVANCIQDQCDISDRVMKRARDRFMGAKESAVA